MLRSVLILVLLGGCVAERPPNIIYILADDLGYGEVGAYGQALIRTPVLDRLAEHGMRFTQHYSGSPVCAPSRCTLITGLHTGHCQVRDNYELGGFADSTERGQLPLEPGTYTLGRMLQDVGYATAIVGKWGLGGPGSTGVPNAQGFDFFYGYLDQKQAHNYYPSHLWRNSEWDTLANGYFHPHQHFAGEDMLNPDAYAAYKGTDYAPDLMAQEAEAFIREHADRPFFLYLPHTVPHLALQVPDEALAEYEGLLDEAPYDGSRGYLPHIRPQSAYAAMITRMDAHIGRLMDVIAELGLTDHTLVMFSSDNGPTYVGGVDTRQFRSSGGLRGGKGEVYEGGIRVPMIAYWPGQIEPGSTTDHVSAFWDVMPTLAELLTIEFPAPLSGGVVSSGAQGRARPGAQRDVLGVPWPELGRRPGGSNRGLEGGSTGRSCRCRCSGGGLPFGTRPGGNYRFEHSAPGDCRAVAGNHGVPKSVSHCALELRCAVDGLQTSRTCGLHRDAPADPARADSGRRRSSESPPGPESPTRYHAHRAVSTPS